MAPRRIAGRRVVQRRAPRRTPPASWTPPVCSVSALLISRLIAALTSRLNCDVSARLPTLLFQLVIDVWDAPLSRDWPRRFLGRVATVVGMNAKHSSSLRKCAPLQDVGRVKPSTCLSLCAAEYGNEIRFPIAGRCLCMERQQAGDSAIATNEGLTTANDQMDVAVLWVTRSWELSWLVCL
jgi:hypothetical protein